MKIGIFIEPKGEVLRIVRIWKKIIKKKFKNQKYLNHPPHLTVAVFDFKKKISINELKNLFKKKIQKKFYLSIIKSSILYNDPITKGDTLVFTVNKNKDLINLQKFIFFKFRKFEKLITKNNRFKNKKFNSNLKKFGYPFVNKEWFPHFTIASIVKKRMIKNFTIDKFLNQKIKKKKIKIEDISIWLINGEKHKKILKINLL